MTESRHAVQLDRMRCEINEPESAPPYLRPFRGWVKWVVALMLIVVLPLALYAGVEIGLHQVNNLFPTASVSCH